MALLSKPDSSSEIDQQCWVYEQPLPTTMGGSDVGGSEQHCGTCFASSMMACAERLRAMPAYDGLDVLKMEAGMFACMKHEYKAVCDEHQRITKIYKTFDKHPYYTVRGGKLKGYFRPDKLPRVLPDLADVMDPESDVSTPAQRALTMVNHHKRWLAALKER